MVLLFSLKAGCSLHHIMQFSSESMSNFLAPRIDQKQEGTQGDSARSLVSRALHERIKTQGKLTAPALNFSLANTRVKKDEDSLSGF